MSCAAHRFKPRRTGARILCFECYRSRLDRPEPRPVAVIPFPRLMSERELAHRRQMLTHLLATKHATDPQQSA
jgi:hypothetical protein